MKYVYSLFFLSVIMISCFNANAAENVVSCNGCLVNNLFSYYVGCCYNVCSGEGC